MNLSLIITLVLIAIVIPWLWRKLFVCPLQGDHTQWLDPRPQNLMEERVDKRVKEPFFENMLSDATAILPTQRNAGNKLRQQQRDLLNQHQFRSLHVLAAPKQYFIGYDLLQALQNAGLEYGSDELFHYYSDDETDEILFSVASSKLPGTFDLQNIGAFSTSALTFFLDTQQIKHPEMVYDIMLNIAEQLAEELGGAVKPA